MAWKNFNDRLALLLIITIPLMWIMHASKSISLPPEVVGALIATWTLVIQYYFRKAPPGERK